MHNEQSWALRSVNWFSVIQNFALCPAGSEVHFLSGFHSVFHCMLLHWTTTISSGLGTCLRTRPSRYFGAHILYSAVVPWGAAGMQLWYTSHTSQSSITAQPNPGFIHIPPQGPEPQHFHLLHVNQTPLTLCLIRGEQKQGCSDRRVECLGSPTWQTSHSVCRTQDSCLPIDF